MKLLIKSALIICCLPLLAQFNFNRGSINSKKYYTELPVEFVNNLMVVTVNIQDKDYRFLFDTGAVNLISKELNNQLELKELSNTRVKDSNNKTHKLPIVLMNSFKINELEFLDTPTVVADFNAIPVFQCLNVDGFIGSNVLRNSIVRFDKMNQKIIITNQPKKLNLNKNESIKIKLKNNQSAPYTWIHLGNKVREYVLIDTGYTGLYNPTKENLKVLKENNAVTVIKKATGFSSVGLFGLEQKSTSYLLNIPRVQFAEFEIQNLNHTTSNDSNSKIGSELLDYGVLTLDYKRKRLYFVENQSILKKDELPDPVDFAYDGKTITIGFIWDESLQEELKVGDEVLEINDENISTCKLFLNSKKEKLTSLLIKRGNITKRVVVPNK